MKATKKMSKEVIAITYTQQQIAALADAFGKSFWTIERWVKKNDDRLTSDKAKQVLSVN